MDNLYRIADPKPNWMIDHPHQNSDIVEGAQYISTFKSSTSPADKEGKKIDMLTKKSYSTSVLGLKVANYVGCMGAYSQHLMEKLALILEHLPEEHKLCAIDLQQEAHGADAEDVAENMSAQSPPAEDPTPCPLCDRRFPISEIELHAMYCNGTGEDTSEDAPVMTRRQREAKNKVASSKETLKSVDIDKHEKCYICKSLVPWKAYQRHVDGCLKSQNISGVLEGRTRLQRAKEEERSEGRLLNMLDQSEHRAVGWRTALDAAVPDTPPRGEDSSMAETDKGAECSRSVWTSFPQAACSDSPIRSFTSISEAKDCLVDFKKQLAIGSGSQKQTKANLRSKKKF
ncbi:hypothetical protein JD844_012410 [Phrynosoma platyrhinos]|uniref:UBZ4-type domain-containing protein n=1 Tax=Phrynosoma platyrhinos TaxID=52577 RepID=A0ABQ7TJR0_PHRPL|nr:hypothetical protein JD844_012410 [Phrynosoma platyrhinos]